MFQDGSGRPSKLKRRRLENQRRPRTPPHRKQPRGGSGIGPGPQPGLPRALAEGRTPTGGASTPSMLRTVVHPAGNPGVVRSRPKQTAQTPPGTLDRRSTGRDVLLGEKCVTPTPGQTAAAEWRLRTGSCPSIAKTPSLVASAARRAARLESPLSNFRVPPVYSQTVSRTLELSLQSSFQLSLTVLVRYRSRGRIQS